MNRSTFLKAIAGLVLGAKAVQAAPEGDVLASVKPLVPGRIVERNSLATIPAMIVPVTDELLEDAAVPAGTWITANLRPGQTLPLSITTT